jgi:Peptidase family M48
MKTCRMLAGVLALFGLFGCSEGARAQSGTCAKGGSGAPSEAHARMLKSLVFLRAKAVTKGGNPTASEATGFLVSPYGDVLTVHHFYRKLGDYQPKTLQVWGSLKGKEGEQKIIVAASRSFDESADLLKLRFESGLTDVAAGEIDSVCFVPVGEIGMRREQKSLLGLELLTSGFPNNAPYIVDKGTIAALEGNSHNWRLTGLTFIASQSGSPIYLPDGRVIGLVKGLDSEAPSHQFIVPIERWSDQRMWDAQAEWMFSQLQAKKAPGVAKAAPDPATLAEQMEICRKYDDAKSEGILRVLLTRWQGTMAGDCLRARLDEITNTKTDAVSATRSAPEVAVAVTGARGATATRGVGKSTATRGVSSSNAPISNARPDQRARDIVEEIAKAAGVSINFKVRISEQFNNAWSMKDENGDKLIVVSSAFLADLERTSAAKAVLAHELGHIVSGHLDTPPNKDNLIRQELEADYFSGFAQAKLGVPRDEAQSFFRTLPEAATDVHPGRAERLDAVGRGWDSSNGDAAEGRSAGRTRGASATRP